MPFHPANRCERPGVRHINTSARDAYHYVGITRYATPTTLFDAHSGTTWLSATSRPPKDGNDTVTVFNDLSNTSVYMTHTMARQNNGERRPKISFLNDSMKPIGTTPEEVLRVIR
jgi:hypothetical protein